MPTKANATRFGAIQLSGGLDVNVSDILIQVYLNGIGNEDTNLGAVATNSVAKWNPGVFIYSYSTQGIAPGTQLIEMITITKPDATKLYIPSLDTVFPSSAFVEGATAAACNSLSGYGLALVKTANCP